MISVYIFLQTLYINIALKMTLFFEWLMVQKNQLPYRHKIKTIKMTTQNNWLEIERLC